MLTDILATYRLARLITQDAIFTVPRTHLRAKLFSEKPHSLHNLVTCPYCISVHIALWITLYRSLHNKLPKKFTFVVNFLLKALAVSGAVSAFHDALELKPTPNPNGWG